MRINRVSGLSDVALWRAADSFESQERAATLQLLLCIAELDARRLYAADGYPSMHACCVGRWDMSDEVAYKHIAVARAGRRFAVVFEALADGRLHLSAVVVLASHLK